MLKMLDPTSELAYVVCQRESLGKELDAVNKELVKFQSCEQRREYLSKLVDNLRKEKKLSLIHI